MLLDAQAVLDLARHDDVAAEGAARDAVRVLAAHARAAGFAPELLQARLHPSAPSSQLAHLHAPAEPLPVAGRAPAPGCGTPAAPRVLVPVPLTSSIRIRAARRQVRTRAFRRVGTQATHSTTV